ncbi:phospholipase D-like domain-containing protein [Leptolyngbya sp. AN02str]|uniref:phospholipase D-like domain-containing protein n=1 Tax=Leptolyngbya sp. AN02str TaxID=3423363 RepID=UPI003D30F3C3
MRQQQKRFQLGSVVRSLLGLVALGVAVSGLSVLGVMYMRGAFRTSAEYELENAPAAEDPRFALAMVSLGNAIASEGAMTGFWVGAEDIYAARLAAIREAQFSIRFETYYMQPGQRADDFAAALIERSQAGVKVQVIADDHGSDDIPDEYWQTLENEGIEVRLFRQFDWRSPTDYNSRTHRKLLIIDGQTVLTGGAGVSDEWDGDPEIDDRAPWLEFEVRYEGAIAQLLEGLFLQNWVQEGGSIDLAEALQPRGSTQSAPQPDSPDSTNLVPEPDPTAAGVQVEASNTNPTGIETTGATAAVEPLYITDDSASLGESSVRMLTQLNALAATERLWLSSPYFIPDANTRRALMDAQNRGVDVRILTMSEKTDKELVHYTSREMYGDLLRAGVQICEYQPSMMHAKMTLVDRNWASTGSANFDPRSYFHNDELNISASHPELVQNLEQFFSTALQSSQCLTYEQWQQRPIWEQAQGRFGLLFKNLL